MKICSFIEKNFKLPIFLISHIPTNRCEHSIESKQQCNKADLWYKIPSLATQDCDLVIFRHTTEIPSHPQLVYSAWTPEKGTCLGFISLLVPALHLLD
jgi:hypothetical protein